MTGLFLCLSLLGTPSPQAPAPQTPAQSAPARLNGVWDLNKDLSTKPMAQPGERGGEGERGGGRTGGGSMPGGRMGGGRGAGMGGGRGGGMRGGGGGGRSGNAADMQKARGLMRELGQSAARLTIVSRPESLKITDPGGVTRTFATQGKSEKVSINGGSIEVKSKWDADVLSQEFKAGSAKFIRTIETTIDGRQLVITMTPKGDGGRVAGQAFLRLVYDRAEM